MLNINVRRGIGDKRRWRGGIMEFWGNSFVEQVKVKRRGGMDILWKFKGFKERVVNIWWERGIFMILDVGRRGVKICKIGANWFGIESIVFNAICVEKDVWIVGEKRALDILKQGYEVRIRSSLYRCRSGWIGNWLIWLNFDWIWAWVTERQRISRRCYNRRRNSRWRWR